MSDRKQLLTIAAKLTKANEEQQKVRVFKNRRLTNHHYYRGLPSWWMISNEPSLRIRSKKNLTRKLVSPIINIVNFVGRASNQVNRQRPHSSTSLSSINSNQRCCASPEHQMHASSCVNQKLSLDLSCMPPLARVVASAWISLWLTWSLKKSLVVWQEGHTQLHCFRGGSLLCWLLGSRRAIKDRCRFSLIRFRRRSRSRKVRLKSTKARLRRQKAK